MRKYENVGQERTATMERINESYACYHDEHVLVSTESPIGHAFARVGSYAEGVEWLMSEFGGGWTRIRR